MRRFSNAARRDTARRGVVVLLLLLALSGLALLAGCGSSGGITVGTSGPIASATPTGSRQLAPDFSGTTMDGVAVSSEGFKGKPTVLVFWASW